MVLGLLLLPPELGGGSPWLQHVPPEVVGVVVVPGCPLLAQSVLAQNY